MNSVALTGRLVRDPDVRYTSTQMCIATFNLAVDRNNKKGETDFPRVTIFGEEAEKVEKYCRKGKLIDVYGRLQTGSYTNKKGETVYTTDVVANRIEFVKTPSSISQEAVKQETQKPAPNDFAEIDEDVPF